MADRITGTPLFHAVTGIDRATPAVDTLLFIVATAVRSTLTGPALLLITDHVFITIGVFTTQAVNFSRGLTAACHTTKPSIAIFVVPTFNLRLRCPLNTNIFVRITNVPFWTILVFGTTLEASIASFTIVFGSDRCGTSAEVWA